MDSVQIKDSAAYVPLSELQADAWLGLQTSIRNRQSIMAMDYLVRVIGDLKSEITDLRGQLTELKKPAPAPKKTTTRTPKKEESNEGGQS